MANPANSGQSRPIQANPDHSGLFRDNPRQFRPISMPTWANPRQCGPIRANQGRFFYYVKSNHGVVILPHFITKKIHDNKIIHRFYFFAICRFFIWWNKIMVSQFHPWAIMCLQHKTNPGYCMVVWRFSSLPLDLYWYGNSLLADVWQFLSFLL